MLSRMGWRIVRAGWKGGPAAAHVGEALISFTDFTFARWRDLPGAWLAGVRLRRSWPTQPGAIGLMLWAKPLSRRSGSISAWRSQADLERFVRSEQHVAIMRRYRAHMTGTSSLWSTSALVPEQAIADARARLRTP